MFVNGVILIDKPKNWTSFDVVAKIRSLIRQNTGLKRPKVGHAGTLDPLATGLLVVLTGDECKNAQTYSKLDKTYQVEIKLGQTSTTDDAEGEIISVNDRKPDSAEINQALESFLGRIEQVPPAFSAIKVDGKRAYKLAREGKAPEIKARPVTIYSISNIIYDYPKLRFITEVSSGTYIRSLARDLGEKLGTGAYMSNLRRTKIKDFKIENAHKIDALNKDDLESLLA